MKNKNNKINKFKNKVKNHNPKIKKIKSKKN